MCITSYNYNQWPCNRNPFIGGTYHICSADWFQAYGSGYIYIPPKTWPEIWYFYVHLHSVGSWVIPIETMGLLWMLNDVYWDIWMVVWMFLMV